MTQVDQNRLKGNFGASYVAMRLNSENCLVRIVPSDTDVGVDLFCETVEGNAPFLHFWVQVKTGKKCRVLKHKVSASYRFDGKHLDYWRRQPVPVFAALVPTDWPVTTDPTVYLIDITSHIIEKGTKQLTLRSSMVWKPDDKDAIREFLTCRVPYTSAKLLLQKGVCSPIPTIQPSYVQEYPDLHIRTHIKQILNQLRTTSAFSILFMKEEGTIDDKSADEIRLLAKAAELFGTYDPHWENFMAVGLSYHLDREFDKAISQYKRAKHSIQGDRNVSSDPTWQHLVDNIEIQIAKAQNKQPVDGSRK